MEISYESSDDEADAMAKAMGFSAFGTQGPPKKRKFNPNTDAVVDGQELAALDKGGKKGQGSGGNMIPLGKPRVFGVAKVASNEDEIDVDEEEDEEVPAYIDTSRPPPAEVAANGEEAGLPSHAEMRLPPLNEESRAAQEKIDAILAGSPAVAQPVIKGKQEPNRGLAQFMTALHQPLPPKPPVEPPSKAAMTSSSSSQRPREKGQRNELWYVGYYDPSFNENPWAKLEKANNLQPKGTWLER